MPLADSILSRLREIVGAENVLTAEEDVIPYGFDGTAALKQRPQAVILPLDTSQVAACVKLAAENKIPVVTRGSGTGLSGGSVPSEGCLVLCLVKMDKIISVDATNLTVRAQCGVITAAIDAAANKHGLFYRPTRAR